MPRTSPLEGQVVIVPDEPEVARRLEVGLAQAGATVFLSSAT